MYIYRNYNLRVYIYKNDNPLCVFLQEFTITRVFITKTSDYTTIKVNDNAYLRVFQSRGRNSYISARLYAQLPLLSFTSAFVDTNENHVHKCSKNTFQISSWILLSQGIFCTDRVWDCGLTRSPIGT